MANGILEIPNFQQEDAGLYECVAENSRGKNVARGQLTFYGKSVTPGHPSQSNTASWHHRFVWKGHANIGLIMRAVGIQEGTGLMAGA